jgi:hypothetical protein
LFLVVSKDVKKIFNDCKKLILVQKIFPVLKKLMPKNCELCPCAGAGGDGNYAKLSWDDFPYVGLSKVWLTFLYHKCNYVRSTKNAWLPESSRLIRLTLKRGMNE